ncbi:hydrogenase [Candidatus Thorarchaeota archaeon]|nr:MAG: hydrogenase [Candidatus Thorarchaeota archaeon]
MPSVIVSEESPILGFYELAFHAPGTSYVRTYYRRPIGMLPGKVPPEILQRIVFSKLGRSDPDVILGPEIGEDAAVIKVGDQVVIAATDPITGSLEDVGWLAVHVNANDIATFGVSPRWFLASVMLPPGYTPDQLGKIMNQIDSAAKELDIAVTGGHSEITESVSQPIVVGFMMGIAPTGRYVTSSGAKPGDALIVTKTIGIEGTSILATEGASYLSNGVGKDIVEQGQNLKNSISVVKDGVTAFQTGFIHAMHDPTEGGLANGVHEICDASGVGCELENDLIPIHEATRKICEYLQISPLELISSGSMLISCESRYASKVIDELNAVGIDSAIIGLVTADATYRKVRLDGMLQNLPRPSTDALWAALKKISLS